MAKKKNSWGGLLFGPFLIFASLGALWKNETRFDFYRAAAKTEAVQELSAATENQLISHTGAVDQKMKIAGHYVNEIEGYLYAQRSAEIYSWVEKKDDDRPSTWNLKWTSNVQSNSRNHGIQKTLESKRLFPKEYQIGNLNVDVNLIEFVDSSESIDIQSMELSQTGRDSRLAPRAKYFYLSKSGDQNQGSEVLGDERLSFSGIPTPAQATWFGKYSSGRGTADTTHQRSGFINKIIQDTGVLHHLVTGDRTTALSSIKGYLQKVKWIVRLAGSAFTVLGFVILFSTFVGFLFHIPVLGRIAETGVFLVSCAIGIPLAILTITVAYLFAHPLALVVILLGIGGGLYFLRSRAKTSQTRLKQELTTQYGHEINDSELKELEFLELATLAFADDSFDAQESDFLQKWSLRQGWDQDQYELMLGRAMDQQRSRGDVIATEPHLKNLIRLALADGQMDRHELRTIKSVAYNIGYDDHKIREMLSQFRSGVAS